MSKERVLITVKTYPTLSRKYGETVCTAGVRADGSWLRIYPVPFRRLDEAEQYRKFDWLECDLEPTSNDVRPESRRPRDVNQLIPVGHLGTDDGWRKRRRLLLTKCDVYTSMNELIDGAKTNRLSLAVFKPARILDFICEEEDRDWSPAKVAEFRAVANQTDMFGDESWRETFKLIPKLPYSFYYRFEDVDGKRSELQILDWEIGALYWNCLRDARGDERVALAKVRSKYLTEFLKADLHFFLGTTLQWHLVGTNPWVIIGVFPIPYERQASLF